MQTLAKKQRTLATLDISMHEIEAVDKQSIIHEFSIKLVDVKIMHINELYSYA